jgi:acetyl/propionyl-CoA carboxylase alpha subunit
MSVWAETRDDAIARMVRAFEEYSVAGIKTNTAFFRQILEDSEFKAGNLHTGFIAEFFARNHGAEPDDRQLDAIAALIALLHDGNRRKAVESRQTESRWRAAGREGIMR